jgi:hypothetical protein
MKAQVVTIYILIPEAMLMEIHCVKIFFFLFIPSARTDLNVLVSSYSSLENTTLRPTLAKNKKALAGLRPVTISVTISEQNPNNDPYQNNRRMLPTVR